MIALLHAHLPSCGRWLLNGCHHAYGPGSSFRTDPFLPMGASMFRVPAAVAAALALCLMADDALAFGDVCHKDVAARGAVESSMSRAQTSAIAAWEKKVAAIHGRRFANWWYSGERLIECSWNKAGSRFSCNAIAIPCGRRR